MRILTIIILTILIAGCDETVIKEGNVVRIEDNTNDESFWGHEGGVKIVFDDSTMFYTYMMPFYAQTGDSLQLVEKMDLANGTHLVMRKAR